MHDTRDFDYELPPELIAQQPASERDAARLLTLHRQSGRVEHRSFRDLPRLLDRPSLLVVNDTRVFPARLIGARDGGARVELLLLRRLAVTARGELWSCLGRPRRRLRPGTRASFGAVGAVIAELRGEEVVAELTVAGPARHDGAGSGERSAVAAWLHAEGHVPLPPYIRRGDEHLDRERYQTIFARGEEGSVAAPTAGLHFTPRLVDELRGAGHRLATITLHVGPGTFRPVRTETLTEHRMDAERYEVGESAAREINEARAEGRRVIAVGTTTVRTLESVSDAGGRVSAGSGSTGLFILPGHEFRVVEGLVTNFHFPRSTLLALVSAFAGRDRVLAAYREAVSARYRFYSYGDAMLIT
jgi:S-adenosylmethionine:tRNA ribosyltransferase-isomerase